MLTAIGWPSWTEGGRMPSVEGSRRRQVAHEERERDLEGQVAVAEGE